MIIDGKIVSAAVKDSIKAEVAKINAAGGSTVQAAGLAVILVGSDPASQVYVRNKGQACEYCGIKSFMYVLPETASTTDVVELVETLNTDKNVHGILVQQPFPKHIDTTAVVEAVSAAKDVDAFRADSVGRIVQNTPGFLPCTPAGVMEMLKYYNIEVAGRECVVIGRSNIVGKPMAMLLLHENGTVTVCHSRTANLPEVTRRADILVSAVGRAKFVTADMVKPGAVVIDVGMNRDENGKLCGDVDFAAVAPIAGYITPVPGGVGLMTIAMLMKNTLTAYKNITA